VSLNEGIGREAKDLLLILAMPVQERPQWFTSDGVIRLAAMIVAGLVKVTHGPPELFDGRNPYPWPGAYQVDLTEGRGGRRRMERRRYRRTKRCPAWTSHDPGTGCGSGKRHRPTTWLPMKPATDLHARIGRANSANSAG
jgi:hypothetical protein